MRAVSRTRRVDVRCLKTAATGLGVSWLWPSVWFIVYMLVTGV
ncbi:hypothetical protein MPS_1185 [Mycobacterium pseudoshottsii JCM 15466]|nr:hypothetical protein MPS_1185 [Mycobacterium pseudoshottsii JCM 15466]